jgi:hypothetical protein
MKRTQSRKGVADVAVHFADGLRITSGRKTRRFRQDRRMNLSQEKRRILHLMEGMRRSVYPFTEVWPVQHIILAEGEEETRGTLTDPGEGWPQFYGPLYLILEEEHGTARLDVYFHLQIVAHSTVVDLIQQATAIPISIAPSQPASSTIVTIPIREWQPGMLCKWISPNNHTVFFGIRIWGRVRGTFQDREVNFWSENPVMHTNGDHT